MIQNQVFFWRSSIAIITDTILMKFARLLYMVQVGQPKNIEGCLNTFTFIFNLYPDLANFFPMDDRHFGYIKFF
jgi:hypothetical protein